MKSISLFDNEITLLNFNLICNDGVKEYSNVSNVKTIKGFSFSISTYCKPNLTWGNQCLMPTTISAPKN